jgi:hypothetical protein
VRSIAGWFRDWVLPPLPEAFMSIDWITDPDEDNDDESPHGFNEPTAWEPGDQDDEDDED